MRRSLVDILNTLGVIVVIIIVAFAAYSLLIDKPFYRASSYWGSDEGTSIGSEDDSGTYTTDKAVDRIEVKNISGRIEVAGWNEDYVQLDYQKYGPGRPPEVKIGFDDSSLKIAAVYPKAPGNFGSVDFFLKVPKDAAYLHASSVSGGIDVSGTGNTLEQKLSTTSGNIVTEESGDLEISSVSGTLKFGSAGRRISASTTSGRIDGELEKISDSGEIDMKSVSGRVSLEVPPDFSAEVDLHSVSGGVTSELPVSVTESKRNKIEGTIGSGNSGTELEISTVSGSIKIIKR